MCSVNRWGFPVIRKRGMEERMKKLKNDNRTNRLVKFDGEGLRHKEGNKIKIKKRNKGKKE